MNYFLMLNIVLVTQVAHASEVPPQIDLTKAVVFGRGVQNRKTKEVLLLSCIELAMPSECKTMKFVHVDAVGVAKEVGLPMVVPQASTPEVTRKAIQLKVREYLTLHETPLSQALKEQYFKWFLVAEASLLVYVGLSDHVFTKEQAIAITFGGGTFAAYYFTRERAVSSLGAGVALDAKVLDENQWNWRESPDVVSDLNFKGLLSQVEATRQDLYTPEYLSAIKRKMSRLTRRFGVKF